MPQSLLLWKDVPNPMTALTSFCKFLDDSIVFCFLSFKKAFQIISRLCFRTAYDVPKFCWKAHIRKFFTPFEERCHIRRSESCNATADERDKKLLLWVRPCKFLEPFYILPHCGKSTHRVYGIALPLQSVPLSHNGPKAFYCLLGSSSIVKSPRIRAEDKYLVASQTGDMSRCCSASQIIWRCFMLCQLFSLNYRQLPLPLFKELLHIVFNIFQFAPAKDTCLGHIFFDFLSKGRLRLIGCHLLGV